LAAFSFMAVDFATRPQTCWRVEEMARKADWPEYLMNSGRIKARTWDPLIKSHPERIDISAEFSRLNQNRIIVYQRLAAKNPTAMARRELGGSTHPVAVRRSDRRCWLTCRADRHFSALGRYDSTERAAGQFW